MFEISSSQVSVSIRNMHSHLRKIVIINKTKLASNYVLNIVAKASHTVKLESSYKCSQVDS